MSLGFLKLDQMGLGFGVTNKVRIDLESRECLFYLAAKSEPQSRVSGLQEMVNYNVPRLSKFFKISFLIPKEQMRYYLNFCADKEQVITLLKDLEMRHSFFYCTDFYENLAYDPTIVHIDEMVEELTTNSKAVYRGKKFIRQLVDEGQLTMPKDKSAMPDKIPLDYKIVTIINNYGTMHESQAKHRQILEEKATFTKPNGESYHLKGNNFFEKAANDLDDPDFMAKLEMALNEPLITWLEKLGFKFKQGKAYLALTGKRIFKEIGT